jgi:hypothetical protein
MRSSSALERPTDTSALDHRIRQAATRLECVVDEMNASGTFMDPEIERAAARVARSIFATRPHDPASRPGCPHQAVQAVHPLQNRLMQQQHDHSDYATVVQKRFG